MDVFIHIEIFYTWYKVPKKLFSFLLFLTVRISFHIFFSSVFKSQCYQKTATSDKRLATLLNEENRNNSWKKTN